MLNKEGDGEMSILKQLRLAAGLTQAQTAAAVGINVMTYQRYEYEKRYPDVLTALRIADALKVKDLRRIWSEHSSPSV